MWGSFGLHRTRSSAPNLFHFVDSSAALGILISIDWQHRFALQLYSAPGYQFSLNASVGRTFQLKSKYSLDFRVDSAYALNHVLYTGWNTTVLAAHGLDNQVQLHTTIDDAISSGVSFCPIDVRDLAEAALGDAKVL